MKASLYTLIYAAVLGTVCSLLLTGTRYVTKDYRDANARAEKFRHILDVLEVPRERDAAPAQLLAAFEKNVRVSDEAGLERYTYVDASGSPLSVAIALEGPGLWGPIKGFLALEPNMKVIRGITFHEQEETPGLGGEIAAEWFRKQFRGKSTSDSSGKPGIRIRKGGGVNEVDGITGATMTCDKVEALINKSIVRLHPKGGADAR